MNDIDWNSETSPQTSLKAAKKDAGQAVEHLKDAAVDVQRDLTHRAGNALDRFEATVQRDPLKWVGIAFAAGYLWRWLRN